MTNKLHYIILDDELKDRENLRILLDNFCPYMEYFGEAEDFDSFITLIEKQKPDIAFIDIQLRSSNIFSLLKKIKVDFDLVVVSAYDQYAIRGYKYNIADYLLKPINRKELLRVCEKLYQKKFKINDVLTTNLESKPLNTKITLSDAKRLYIIDVTDIIYCKSMGNYTEFILHNQSKIVISKKLKYFEELLTQHQFFRCHKSYLLNLNNIDYVSKIDGLNSVMKNADVIPIANSYKKILFDLIKKL